MLRIQGLRKSFPATQTPAVDGLSIDIADGEFLTLLGPSGCGKTTTLRCIAGLEEPDAGEITIGDTIVCSSRRRINLPPHRRPVGMVFQSYAIWPHMTVWQNIAYPLKNLRKSRSEIAEAVAWALQLVGLESMASRPAPFLSGGEQQRVALARALVEHPKVLLLDEPLSNLDAKLRDEMRSELKALQKKLGFTAVYVTHDQDDAFCLADTLAVMSGGAIVEIGSPEDVYDFPRTAFGAEFLGSATRLHGRVTAVAPSGVYDVETSIGTLRCRCRERLEIGTAVFAYVRPEGVQPVLREAPSAQGLIVEAVVKDVFFMGDTLDWRAEVQGIGIKARSLAKTEAGRIVRESIRQRLRLEIPVVACLPTRDAEFPEHEGLLTPQRASPESLRESTVASNLTPSNLPAEGAHG